MSQEVKALISVTIWQLLLLVFLIAKDKNDGEKELFKKQAWRASDVVLVVLLFNILVYLISGAEYFLSALYVIEPFLKKFRVLIFPLLLLFLLIVIFKFRFKQGIKILGIKKRDLKRIVIMSIAAAFIIYLILTVLYLLIGEPGTYLSPAKKAINNLKDSIDFGIYILSVLVLGPIVEEGIFRGVLYSPYRKKYGAHKAILITALFFSISHFGIVGIGLLPSFISGIFFGVLYEKTESIISPIVAHSTYNLFSFLTVVFLLK